MSLPAATAADESDRGSPLAELPGQRYARASCLASVAAIAACPVAIGLHFLRDVNFPLWWLAVAVLLGLAVGLMAMAVAQLPRPSSPRRNRAATSVTFALLWAILAGAVFLGSFVPLSFMLFVKSDAGQAAIQQAKAQHQAQLQRQQEILRQMERRDQQYRQQLGQLEGQIRQAEQQAESFRWRADQERKKSDAEAAQAAKTKASASRTDYQAALLAGLLTVPFQGALPARPEGFQWDSRYPREVVRSPVETRTEESPADLVTTQFVSQGMLVRQLQLKGAEFLPKLAYFGRYDQPLMVALVKRTGEELQISPLDWRLQRTTSFGGECTDLCYSRDVLCVARNQPGSIIYLHHEANNARRNRGVQVIAPRQVTFNHREETGVVTGNTTPLFARLTQSGVMDLRELSRTPGAQKTSRFLTSQLGGDTYIRPDRSILVAQRDGLYRGVLPPDKSTARNYFPLDFNGGYLTLDGESFVSRDERWPVAEITWQKLVPAAGIDVTRFATLGGEWLATCNDQTNLILFDTTGKPHSRHNWPQAGRTLGLAGVRDLQLLVVFTENGVYVVSPASGSVAQSTSTSKPGTRIYPQAASAAQPRAATEKIAGNSYEVPGAKVTEFTTNFDTLVWGQSAEELYALQGSTVHRINARTMTSERSIDIGSEERVVHLSRTKSRVVLIAFQSKRLLALDPQSLAVQQAFQIGEYKTRSKTEAGYFAASPHTDRVAISLGPFGQQRTDIVSVLDGSVSTSLTAQDLRPAGMELYQMAMGPDGQSLAVLEKDRFYWLKLKEDSWEQTQVDGPRDNYRYNAELHVAPAAGKVFVMGDIACFIGFDEKTSNDLLRLWKPKTSRVDIDPSGEFYWSDEVKKYNLRGKVVAEIPLRKPGGRVQVFADGKRLLVGNQLVELTAP